MKAVSIKVRFAVAGLILLAGMVAVGALGLQGMLGAKEGLRTVYEDRVVPLKQLKHVADAYAVSVIDVVNKANAGLATAEDTLKAVDTAQSDIKREWGQYAATSMTPDEKKLAQEVAVTMAAADASVVELERFLTGKSGSLKGALGSFDGPLYATVDPVSGKISDLVELQLRVAQESYDAAVADYDHKRVVVVSIAAIVAAAAALVGFLLYRNIVPPMLRLAGQMREITAGNTELQVDSDRRDELGEVVSAFRDLFGKVRSDLAEAQQRATVNERIRQALDSASTNVMVADTDGTIVFMNKSVTEMLGHNEAELRKMVPGFSVSGALGANFDAFHRNPSHQRNMLAALQSTHRTQIKVGPLTFALTANPIVDSQGQRIGTVVEWRDRTVEAEVEDEIGKVVSAAAAGDYSQRVPEEGKSGFFLQMAQGLNRIVEVSESGIKEVGRVSRALAAGDLSQKVTGDFDGQFAELQADSNETNERLREVIGQIRESVESITTASKEIAAGNTDLSGRTEEQASSLEETASSMEQLTSTVKQNADNARQANQLVVGASEVAQRGGDVVREVVVTMGGISESSKKIADIISVIDGIAFQTNILALNAAVEAARAGEQGRGFAVVATEVRNLAQRSAGAAKEIKELISDSVGKVESGSRLVDEAGRTMEEIVVSVKRVTDIMAEITAASVEQSAGIEQVNQAITQMDEVTQQNAALVEQAAAAAESLEEQAQMLSQAVAVFKLGQEGEGWDGKVERRGPERAKNVARLPKQGSPKAGKAVAKPKVLGAPAAKVVGGDAATDEWEEF